MAELNFNTSFLPPRGYDQELGLEWTAEEAVRAVITDDEKVERFLKQGDMFSLLVAFNPEDANKAKPEIYGLQYIDYDEYDMNCVLGERFISPLLDGEQAEYLDGVLGRVALGRYEDLY